MALSVVRSEPSPAELLARLRAGDSRPLDELYRSHRGRFDHWVRQRVAGLTDDDVADGFQQAVITFYEHVVSGHLHTLTAAPSTYVFRIGERICYAAKNKVAGPIKFLPLSDIKGIENDPAMPDTLLTAFLTTADPRDADDPEIAGARVDQVDRALRQLSADCYRLLTAFYYDAQPLPALSAEFGHRDPEVTAVRKSQCLAKLRTLCGVTRR